MRKVLLAICLFFVNLSLGLSQTAVWTEFDGAYWQKFDGLSVNGENYLIRSGSFRPFLGMGLGKSWSLGLMGDFLAYRDREADVSSYLPVYNPNSPQPENPEIIGYQQINNFTAKSNAYFSFGMFLRKSVQLGKRTSLNLSLYGLKGTGAEGNYEIFPEFYPGWNCPMCLSFVPGPLEFRFKEESWRFGLDFGFNWVLSSWMAFGLKANFFEFRKQILSSYPQISNGFELPQWPSGNSMNYGSRIGFGSAVVREGIRVSINFTPFSSGKSEAQ
ncbi:hypothetical protein ACFPIK_08820 [Algoriphagus aquatilis]|uniref:Outer membrane protein beta-barrel domain-containing protein n=1 Tax=Algoriphagus aquatilis TaxID=490186 RepID=A0ABW0BY34_9BACT